MQDDATEVIERLHADVDALLALDLDSLASEALLDLVRATETLMRRLVPVQHAQTAEVDRRGLAHEHGCATTGVLLSQLLRVSAGEARARVRAADRLAPRRSFTGEVLPPLYPVVASAQAEGAISAQHSSLITTTIDKLPTAVDVGDTIARIEEFLTEQARLFAPEPLGMICRHLREVLDPDGTLSDKDTAERRRGLRIHRHADGTVTGKFEGTAEFGELLQTVLDVFAAPKPATDGTRDQRTAEQRNHDGLIDALRLVLRAGDMPSANGVVATVVLSMTAAQWATEQGLATTGHGALITVSEAKDIARGEARIFPVVLDDQDDRPPPDTPPDTPPSISRMFQKAKPIIAYGTVHRLFTEGQKLALAARDRGCTFPGCTVPVLWCEADHVTDWKDTGRTCVDDGHLACRYHHRLKTTDRWQTTMLDGLPHWIAPTWLDPPRPRNATVPTTPSSSVSSARPAVRARRSGRWNAVPIPDSRPTVQPVISP